MKKKLFILFTLLVIDGYCQNEVDQNGLRQGYWKFENRYDSISNISNTILKVYFINDTIQGESQVIDNQGVVRSEVKIVNGKPNGIGKMYDKNGYLIKMVYLKEGKVLNETTFIKGKITLYCEYNSSQQTDSRILFRKNGRVAYKKQFANGLEVEFTSFYRNGNRRLYINYGSKDKIGETIIYRRNGTIKAIK